MHEDEDYSWVPEAESTDSVEAAREVLRTKSARRVSGVLLDAMTANAIVTVADALGDENRARLGRMPITSAANVAWKLVK